MVELLNILARWLSFFFATGRYRLVNSESSPSFGNALIDIASGDLEWRLVRDRSQVFLDCRPVSDNLKSHEWFSADLLIRLLSNRRVESAELTSEMARWFEENLSEIEKSLSGDRMVETVGQLKRLKQLRSKELFG